MTEFNEPVKINLKTTEEVVAMFESMTEYIDKQNAELNKMIKILNVIVIGFGLFASIVYILQMIINFDNPLFYLDCFVLGCTIEIVREYEV